MGPTIAFLKPLEIYIDFKEDLRKPIATPLQL
jgi:hypothetical protein